jgi:hypothetical protein
MNTSSEVSQAPNIFRNPSKSQWCMSTAIALILWRVFARRSCVQVSIEPGPVGWEDFLKYKIFSVGRKLKLCFSEDLIFRCSYPIFSRTFACSSDGYPCRWTLRHFEFFLCQVNLPFQLRSIVLNSMLKFLAIKSADKAVIESGHDFNERPTHESSVSPNRNLCVAMAELTITWIDRETGNIDCRYIFSLLEPLETIPRCQQ